MLAPSSPPLMLSVTSVLTEPVATDTARLLPRAALGAALVFRAFGSTFSFVYSGASIVAAFACSTLIGVVFGWLPARGAAQLDPVDALARE